MKRIATLFGVSCIVLLSGCHNSDQDLVKAPKPPPFSIKAMHWYDAATAPAVSEKYRLPEKQATVYSQTLYSALHSAYPGINLIAPKRLRQVIGHHYQDFARYFWQNGWLVMQDRQRLTLNFTHLRYIFFTRVLQDHLTHHYVLRKTPVTKKGKVSVVQTYTTVRDLVLKVEVYDLQSKKVVWHQQDAMAKTVVKTYKQTINNTQQAEDALKHPYPDPISTHALSLALYKKMVKQLPTLDHK